MLYIGGIIKINKIYSMLSKQNEGKVLIIGHQHDEVVVPEVLDKYLTNNDKDQTIVFAMRFYRDSKCKMLRIFKNMKMTLFAKCYKAQTEEDKKLKAKPIL